jgi:hypothetical protein
MNLKKNLKQAFMLEAVVVISGEISNLTVS